MLDTNNDGVISKVELVDFCGVNGISVPKATKALGKPTPLRTCRAAQPTQEAQAGDFLP